MIPSRVLSRLSALLVGTILALGLVETAFRVLRISPRGELPRRVDLLHGNDSSPLGYWGTGPVKRPSPFEPDVRMGEYVPNLTFKFVYASDPRKYFDRNHGVVNHINRWGLRGPDFPLHPSPGTQRILGVGDSFTFGEGVRYEDTFLRKTQDLLAAGGRFTEVINCGVSGYNTRDEMIYLQRRWIQLHPNMVIVTFCINDGYDDAMFGAMHQGYLEGGTMVQGQSGLIAHSKALTWVSSVMQRYLLSRQTIEMYRSQFSGNALLSGYDWKTCASNLNRLVELGRLYSFTPVLVIFPELFQLEGDYPFSSIHDRVEVEARKLGLPVLDLLPTFRGQRTASLWVHPTDHHPNERAHALAANALSVFLAHLLPPVPFEEGYQEPTPAPGTPAAPQGPAQESDPR